MAEVGKIEHPIGKKQQQEDNDVLLVEEEEIYEEEAFKKTLVGKIWTESPYNVRAFKQTIVQAWRLKNTVEVQELSKNLFLFKFSSKRDAEQVLKTGPWSFDRNLVILTRISGGEQPSELAMHTVSFWVRAYDLPLKMRSDPLAKKIGNSIGVFEEIDMREGIRMGKSLRLKVALDLRKPLKRGTTLRYQGRDIWIDFKYERLPTFCYTCGRIGHQIKDCEDNTGDEDGNYSEIEERDQTFGPWLRASPLPKFYPEPKHEPNSGTCSRSLFASSSNSKCVESDEKKTSETEVNQDKTLKEGGAGQSVEKGRRDELKKVVEGVAETLGTVVISNTFVVGEKGKVTGGKRGQKKWTRQKGCRNAKSVGKSKPAQEVGKRHLVDVIISEGNLEDMKRNEKKRHVEKMEVDQPEGVVLESQHHLTQ